MHDYLMFVPETDEEKDFLNKVYFEANKDSEFSKRECLVISEGNKMFGVSLSFFHEMRLDKGFSTRDITYKELKLLAIKHATGEITLK